MTGPEEIEPVDVDSSRAEFAQRVGALLTESCAALDGRTRSQLTQARHAALARLPPRAVRGGWSRLVPVGAVAGGAVALLLLNQPWRPAGVELPATVVAVISPLDDMELLADADGYAISADTEQDIDYDFYEWAAAAAERAPASGIGT